MSGNWVDGWSKAIREMEFDRRDPVTTKADHQTDPAWVAFWCEIHLAEDPDLNAEDLERALDAALSSRDSEMESELQAIFTLTGPPREGFTLLQEIRAQHEEKAATIDLNVSEIGHLRAMVNATEKSLADTAAELGKRLKDRDSLIRQLVRVLMDLSMQPDSFAFRAAANAALHAAKEQGFE